VTSPSSYTGLGTRAYRLCVCVCVCVPFVCRSNALGLCMLSNANVR
jgi:hypothetical protein